MKKDNKKKIIIFIKKVNSNFGFCPSVKTMSEKLNLTEKTIYRHIHFLEKDGKLKINKGKKGPNYYNLV